MRTCEVGGCTSKHVARGLCGKHYQREWSQGNGACSVDECGKPAKSRGLCGMHDQRLRRHGDLNPPPAPRPKRPASERFWEKVDASGDCWLWTAGKTHDGYGMFRTTSASKAYAHRWAWENLVGPIPEGYEVDHLCFVESCVNPDHLEPVTPHENNLRRRVVSG